jgi:hypothetical protein
MDVWTYPQTGVANRLPSCFTDQCPIVIYGKRKTRNLGREGRAAAIGYFGSVATPQLHGTQMGQ